MSNPAAVSRNIPVGYLRAFVTLLVLLHHSVLAYFSQAPKLTPFDQLPLLWTAFPVVDGARWSGFDLLVGFNDIFFMALMFFVSGLFVPMSLSHKGSMQFAAGRLLRLGVPFAVAAAVLAPLAYYPAYLQHGGAPGLIPYWHAWTALGQWPAGPAWFLWVLFVFDAAAALLYLVMPGIFTFLGRRTAGAHPWQFFFVLAAFSAASYLWLVEIYGPYRWLSYGPFFVQAGRMLHYAVYFFAGTAVGAFGLDKGLLSPEGRLARRWWLWLLLAPIVFVLLVAVVIASAAMKGLIVATLQTVAAIGFALSCAVTSLACIAAFLRFAKRANAVWDSLTKNAYGMYIFHYAFASWIQFALLPAKLSGLEKGGVVFISVVAASWLTTAALRRIPLVARII